MAAGLAAEPGAPVKSHAVIAARPLFFERVTIIDPDNPASGKRGHGRFHLELFMLSTPVAGGHEQDAAAVERAMASPSESEHRKLFPGSNWEFHKWSRADMIAFPLCCLCALAILAFFAFILRAGRG